MEEGVLGWTPVERWLFLRLMQWGNRWLAVGVNLFCLVNYAAAGASSALSMNDPQSAPIYHTRDGESFAYRHWPAHGRVRAVVIAFHGLSGAADDFLPLAEVCAARGWAIYAPYLRSQGHDPRPDRRGNHRDFQILVDDMEDFTAFVASRHPGLPLVEVGESMGGMLLVHRHARIAAEPSSVCGMVLLSPVVDLRFEVKPWQRVLFRALTTLAPGYRTQVASHSARQKEPPRMTRDDGYQRRLETAPHRLEALSLRFVGGLTTAIEQSRILAPEVRTPIYTAYGGQDLFISREQVEQFTQILGSPLNVSRFYPESYHLLLHDLDRDRVLDELIAWLETRLASTGRGSPE